MITQPIFLIGARGCGKTTVGQKLAEACHFDFVDTDLTLQLRAQKSIADIVAEEGWPAFRALESATLQSVTALHTVIATGGGIILSAENREYLRHNGWVIYLKASVAVLAGRLEAFPEASQRPTLTGKPISEEVREVLAQRDALYRDTAHFTVDAACEPDDVVAQILAAIATARTSTIPVNSATAG